MRVARRTVTRKSRILFLCLTVGLALLLASPGVSLALDDESTPPNVVVIVNLLLVSVNSSPTFGIRQDSPAEPITISPVPAKTRMARQSAEARSFVQGTKRVGRRL